MKSYPIELRQLVLDAVDSNQGTQQEIAERFSVSAIWIRKLLYKRKGSDSIESAKQAGRMLRKTTAKIDIGKAECKYSVSDGAVWIEKQYKGKLPMLDDNILDVFHFKDHLTNASHSLYGENSKESVHWRDKMKTVALENGSLVLLDRLKECYNNLDDTDSRSEIDSLRNYISKRVAMTDYPKFIDKGYDIGSGPTESFCGCLTKRLKGPGMRWDSDNAEAVMALGSIYYSNLWDTYWKMQRKST